jgi:endonuclease/exonuclease/phosphatase family metal-dependent hydrolase
MIRYWLFALVIFFGTHALPAAEPEAFTVCWWNVQNFGVTDRFINNRYVADAMKPESEMKAVVAILKKINPDILVLGEILRDPEDKYVKLFPEVLRKGGLDFPHATTALGEDPRIQMLIISKYPFAETKHFTEDSFPQTLKSKSGEQVSSTRKVGRAFLNAKVQITPTLAVQVMTAHLKSKRPAPEIASDTAGEEGDDYIRRNEALILRGHMTRFMEANPAAPLLVLGDLNDAIKSPAIKTILGPKDAQHRVRDLWLKDYLGDWWTHFFTPEFSYARIDYMIANEPLFKHYVPAQSYVYRSREGEPPELNHYNASDHRPLVATFKVQPSS